MRTFFIFLSRVYERIRSEILIIFYGLFYGVSFGKNVRIQSPIGIRGLGKIIVGDNVIFGSASVLGTTNKDATIIIGKKTFVNGTIICSASRVEVGEDSILSDCEIMDTSSHGIPPNKRNDPDYVKVSPVKIGKNTWIGSKVIVLPGVTIGQNSIIGVSSVVSKDIPENVFAAGSPAKVLKNLVEEND